MIITTFKSEFERIAAIVGAGFTTKEIQEEQEFAQNYDFTIQPWINWKPLESMTTEYRNDGVMYYQGRCELYFLTKANTFDDMENNKDVLIDQMIDLAELFFANLDKNAERRFGNGDFSMTHEVQREYLSNYLVGTKATISFDTSCTRFVPAADPAPDYVFRYKLNGDDMQLTPVNSPLIVSGVAYTDLLAKNYNGVDQFEIATNTADVAVGAGAFSVSCWFKTSDTGGTTDIFGNGDGATANTFRLRKGGNDKLQLQINGVSGQDSNNVVTSGDWIHAVFVSEGSGSDWRMYLDGSLDNFGTMPVTNITDTGILSVASRADTNAAKWNGDLDDIRFYNRVLTADEVTALKDYSNE